jgi:fatty acid desaturase
MGERANGNVEWPTLALLLLCYLLWAWATVWLVEVSLALAVVVTALAIAQHSSLTHEAVHGHPFQSERFNEAVTFLSLGLFVPWRRFRDLHLAHHEDAVLTDPYDDPESNYLDPAVWQSLAGWQQSLLRVNNTLGGRMLVGPLIGMAVFLRDDWRLICVGDRGVLQAWLLHLPGVALVLGWVGWSPMPVWAYIAAAYAAFSLLKIRTFLEHQAHEHAGGRSVLIADRGPLALLFLNNNLHVIHHMHPRAAWYQLPRLFKENPERYLTRNHGYYYRSYAEVFHRHFWRAKDPVPHPLWKGEGRTPR